MHTIRSIEYNDDQFIFINQTKLPLQLEYISTDDFNRIAEAIERLEIRGAPAIGIAAAYGLALSLKNNLGTNNDIFFSAYNRLSRTRPTAVNLFFALDEMKVEYEKKKNDNNLFKIMVDKAKSIHESDILMCKKIGENGLNLFNKKMRVLTHCNTGALATGGDGTALNIIKNAFNNNLIETVYVDETRPLFQGSRLTAWELEQLRIPFQIITDSTAASIMKEGLVDAVFTGADRIALNGDVANKIGTYNLAVLCRYHNIPFYIAAPTTTIDKNSSSGNQIKIEMRDVKELFAINSFQITSENYNAYAPAFDITPNKLIKAIITEKAVHLQPYNFKDV